MDYPIETCLHCGGSSFTTGQPDNEKWALVKVVVEDDGELRFLPDTGLLVEAYVCNDCLMVFTFYAPKA